MLFFLEWGMLDRGCPWLWDLAAILDAVAKWPRLKFGDFHQRSGASVLARESFLARTCPRFAKLRPQVVPCAPHGI